MESKREDRKGFLARKVIIESESGKTERLNLSIVFPMDYTVTRENKDGRRLEVLMKDYEILPFSSEIPGIEYLDIPLVIRRDKSNKLFIMSAEKE